MLGYADLQRVSPAIPAQFEGHARRQPSGVLPGPIRAAAVAAPERPHGAERQENAQADERSGQKEDAGAKKEDALGIGRMGPAHRRSKKGDRKSTSLNTSHKCASRLQYSA